jgi:aryl-alcohol dehydrogenase-like predicted oxidoreductase
MRLGFGCVSLGSASRGGSRRADVALVREAIDLGVTLFDTADVYGAGASERVLGRALGRRRDEVVIATKGGYLFRERSAIEQRARRIVATARRGPPGRRSGLGGGAGGGHGYDARDDSARHLRTAVEASLRRLRTDHIDVYQLHGPPDVHPDLFEELADLRSAGKVGAFGIGAESVAAARDWLSVPGLAVVQLPFGVLDPEAADDVFAPAARGGVDVWARGVLGGGLIGRAQRDPSAVADDPKAPVLVALREVAARTGRAIDDLAVAFVRSFAAVSTVLFGISTSDHLHRDIALMRAQAPDDELVAELGAVAKRGADGRR